MGIFGEMEPRWVRLFFVVLHPAAPDPVVMKPGHDEATAGRRGGSAGWKVPAAHEFLSSSPPGGAGPTYS